MKTLILGMVLCLIAVPAHAEESCTLSLKCQAVRLDTADKVLLVNAIKLLVNDLGQTLDIANRPGMHEKNPALGLHPNRDKAHFYFAGVTLLYLWAVTLIDDPEVRKVAQMLVIVPQALTVQENSRLGLRSEHEDSRQPIVVSFVFPLP